MNWTQSICLDIISKYRKSQGKYFQIWAGLIYIFPMTRLLLVPPDTRPPTLDLPVQLIEMTGASVDTPPRSALPHFNTPGDTAELRRWLLDTAPHHEALIICLETLCLGGMIPARRVSDPLDTALARLETLRELKQLNPELRIYAFGVVVRVAHGNDPHEEKPYYGQWGDGLRAYSGAFDRHARHGGSKDSLEAARSAVPAEVLADWLGTRQRNHALHQAAVDLLQAGVLEHLCVTLDDTSEYGLAAYDRRKLESRVDELALWHKFDIYPGADEVPCALLARALRCELAPARAWVRYSGTAGATSRLIFEDRPAGELVKTHLRAAGCVPTDSVQDANFILAVNTPGREQAHEQPDFAVVDTPERHLPSFIDQIQSDLKAGRAVSVADIAYPNGAEVRLWKLMQSLPLAELAGYSAWNTAGNTLGSAIAFGALAPLVRNRAKQLEALFGRMVDDALYQAIVRPQLDAQLHHPSPFDLADQYQVAQYHLAHQIEPQIRNLWARHFAASGYTLATAQASLCWPRLFTGVFPLSVG